MTSPAPANPATAAKNGTTKGAISIPAPNGTAQQASQFTEQQVQQMLPRLQQMFSGFTREKLAALVNRAQQLQAINSDEQTHPELQNAMQTLRSFQTYQQLTQRPRSNPTSSPNGSGTPSKSASQSQPQPTASSSNGSQTVVFGQEQLDALKHQIVAYKMLARNVPLPPHVQAGVFDPIKAKQDLQAELPDVASLGSTGQLATAAISTHLGAQESNGKAGENQTSALTEAEKEKEAERLKNLPKFPGPKDDPSSSVYPYNAYTHPFTLLSDFFHSPEMMTATKQQRLLIPSLMPAGMDPQLLLAERDRFTKARIAQRIRELEELPSTMSEMPTIGSAAALQGKENEMEGDNSKIKAIIELKSLQLLDRQKALREQVVRSMNQATTLALDRTGFRRFKKATLRDARQTEQLERKQRVDREKRSRQKHMDYLMTICNHGKDLVAAHRTASQQALKIGRTVLKLHADTERDEARRVERVAKERLNALKADDEEAYLKLIDTAKDTRITHLIRQTDAYLEGLAQAVQAQQNDDVHADAIAAEKAGIKPPSAEEIAAQTANQEVGVAVDETMFGATRQDDPAEDKGKVDYYSVAHRITEHVTSQPKILVGGQLKEYQVKGLQWMVSLYNNRLNGILADEMGLGKTIQTISLITFLIESKKQTGPFLVIVPLSTLTNWVNEFSKWAPSVSILVYKGTPGVRKQLAGRLRAGNFQCLLTTYEYVIKDKNLLGKLKWAHMIIDEGHRMKNTQSKLTVTLTTSYTSRYRLLLTGTPLQNNLPELWALLNFVLPKIFNSVKSFDEWFNTPFANAGGDSGMQLTEEETLLIIKRLHKVLRPFLLRRLKKDVESELPDKVEKVIKCQMSSLQAKLYSGMKKHKMIMTGDDTNMVGKKKNMGIRGLQNAIMQLRKICNHPYVFEQVESAVNPLKTTGPDLYRVSGKFELLDRLLPKLFKTGHRVLIFFQMTAIMDIMEDFLRYRHFKYLRLDGSTKPDDRSILLHEFNKPNSEFFIFILSTRAGGLGLNLQTADTVIIYDSDWNPHQDLQAQDRAHRIGQKMEVRILRLVTEKSVEEHILETANYKLQIDAKVIQAGKYDNQATADERETLLRALLEQNDDDDDERGGEITDEELNQILARGEHEIKRFEEIDEERERNENQMWKASGGKGPKPPRLIQEKELPEMYQQDFDAIDAFKEEPEEEAAHRKRQVVHYDDGLTEDQFTKALEDDDVDMADLVEKKRERDAKRRANKGNDDGSQAGTPEPSSRGRGKKGRAGDDDTPEGSPDPGGRKRKRRSESAAQTPDYEPEGSTSKANAKKRKQPGPDDEIRDRVRDALNSCYTAVENTVDPETGRKRCLLFLDVPKKSDYPDYHVLIAKPIAMRQIKRRITNRTYRSVSTCRDDFHQMFANAKLYNQEGSWVWVDADELQKVFDEAYENFCAHSDLPGHSDPPVALQTSFGPPAAQQQHLGQVGGAPNGADAMMGNGQA